MQRRAFIAGATAVTIGGLAAASLKNMGSSAHYAGEMARFRAPIARNDDVRELVRLASMAASGHNTQPWRFLASGQTIRIIPDYARRTPAVDPDDHHLFVSLGCAAENLSLAAAAAGHPGEVQFDRGGRGSVRFDYAVGEPQPSALCDAIPRRQSTRAEFDGRPAASGDLALLASAGTRPGVHLSLITDRSIIGRVKQLVLAGNSLQMADAAFLRELKSWMRFNPAAALRHGDGLYSASSGNPILPSWLGEALFDVAFRAPAENDKYARQIDTSAGLAVFCGDNESHESWVNVGRACQRFALQATALGMKVSFINQPVEVRDLRPDLAELAAMRGTRPDILMRFGYGPDLVMSPRRPVERIFAVV